MSIIDVTAAPYNATGDGVTDDRAAIMLAIASGQVIYFPAGTYLISDELRIPSNRTLFGAGIESTLIRLSKTAPNMACVLTNSLNTRTEHTEENTNIVIRDMTVDANAHNRSMTNLNQPAQSGITFACVSHSLIERVKVINGGLHGIDISASIYRNTSMGYAVGPSHHISINQCQAWDTRFDDGITTHHSYAISIMDSHSEIVRVPAFQQNGFEIDEGSREVTLINCTSKGFAQGFQVKGHNGSQPASDVTLINCKATECNFGFYIWWSAADSEVWRGSNVTLLGCSVENLSLRSVSPEHAILTSILTEFYSGVRIENFKIKNTPDGGFIRINKWCENITIDGLTIENSLNGNALPDMPAIQIDVRSKGAISVKNVRAYEIKTSVASVNGTTTLDTNYDLDKISAVAHPAGVAKPVIKVSSARSGMSFTNIKRQGFTCKVQITGGIGSGYAGDNDYVVRKVANAQQPIELLNGFTGNVQYSVVGGEAVTIIVYELTPPAGTNGTVTFGQLPPGLFPPIETPITLINDMGQARNVWVSTSGLLRGVFDSALGRVRGSVTFLH